MKNETRVKLLELQTAIDAAHKATISEALEASTELRTHIIEQSSQFGYWHRQIEQLLNPPANNPYLGLVQSSMGSSASSQVKW